MSYLSIEAEKVVMMHQGKPLEVIHVEVNGVSLYFSALNNYHFEQVGGVFGPTKTAAMPQVFLSLEVQHPK